MVLLPAVWTVKLSKKCANGLIFLRDLFLCFFQVRIHYFGVAQDTRLVTAGLVFDNQTQISEEIFRCSLGSSYSIVGLTRVAYSAKVFFDLILRMLMVWFIPNFTS